jgi:drug/metabolite transporter (DMT)-like permease
MSWFSYSLIAAVVLAAHFLILKRLNVHDISLNILIMYMWGMASIALLLYQSMRGHVSIPKGSFPWIIGASITTFLGTWLLNKGVFTAPNPGFATAVGSLQVLIVIIASVFMFGSGFSFMKFIGSVFVVAGVILLGV